MATELQQAYDSATAVFSRAVRFVEWKYVIPAERLSAPLGDREEPPHKATKPIDRVKWIYVFRHDPGAKHAPIREEIRIDERGEMAATPHDALEKTLAARGMPVAIGKTVSLPRRVLGKPTVYRFYASRVRLPLPQIKALEACVYKFAPATILDPRDNTSVVQNGGEWLVPVVDPITVALHFHAAFSAAADDIIDYTAAHEGLSPDERRRVERRRKKHLLATLLKGIIGEKGNKVGDNLVHELKGMQSPLEEFLTHYDQHLDWRIRRRDRLCTYLVNWLSSDAIRVATAAHQASNAFAPFLVPWCHAITRLCEAPAGRKYLLSLLDDKTHFLHTYVWPAGPVSEDAIQTIRKGGMTVLEAWKTVAEARVLLKPAAYATNVAEVVETLRELRRSKLRGKLTPQALKDIVDVNGKIKATMLLEAAAVEPVHHFAAEPRRLGAIIESVNFILSIKSTMEKMRGDDKRAKELALIGLVGSSLDAASAVTSLLKKGQRVAATFSFVSGVIDIYLGVEEMNKAFTDGDQDVANGAFLTAAGATIGTAGTVMALMAIPGGQILGVIGLFVVAAGFLIKVLKGKDPLQRFFDRCSWGNHHLQAGGADWSPTRFEQWKGEKEFDYQFEALLNIICKIEIAHGDTYRQLKFTIAWLPPNAKLVVRYDEVWRNSADSRTLEGTVVMTDKGPTSSNPRLAATPAGKSNVAVTADVGLPSKPPTVVVNNIRVPHKELKRAAVTAKLLLTFDGMAAVTIPHKGLEKKTFHD